MKRRRALLSFVISASLMLGACSSKAPRQDEVKHLLVSAAIAATVAHQVKLNGASSCGAAGAGVVVTLAIGALKEQYDRDVKGTEWSNRDMLWNLVGASVGALAVAQCP